MFIFDEPYFLCIQATYKNRISQASSYASLYLLPIELRLFVLKDIQVSTDYIIFFYFHPHLILLHKIPVTPPSQRPIMVF